MQENRAIEKISLREQIIYGSGDIALNICYTMFSSFVLYFYTNTMLLNAAMAGVVILISRIFDGISDIIAGHIIDNTKAKNGHCIPWLKRCMIPYAVCFVIVFIMPHSSTAAMLAYLFVTYNLFNTVVFTMQNLAHLTLPAFVTDDQKTRSTMIVIKMIFAAGTQIIIANVTLPAVEALGGDQAAWIKLSAIFAVISIVDTFIMTSVVKERILEAPATQEKKQNISIWKELNIAVRNKYWLITLGLAATGTAQLVFSTTISTYYMDTVVGNANLVGIFVLCMNLPCIFEGLFMEKLFHYFTKSQIALVGTIFQIVGEVIFIIGPTSSLAVLFISALIRGIGFGVVYPLATAMVIDTIEYGEWKTGIRVQGVLTSAQSVAQKVMNGIGTSVFGFVLTAVAYDGSKTVQVESAVRGIEGFFKWGPMVVYAIQLVLLLLYKLDEEYPQIMKDLEERRAAATQSATE